MTGRTHRGFLSELSLNAVSDLDDQDLSALTTRVAFSYFLPLAPRHRVLVLHTGTALATPLGQASEIPLASLVSLGRASGLRGYTARRFRDRSGYWGSIEYRYPVYDFDDTKSGLSAALFVDAGGVSRSPRDYFSDPVHVAPGIGLRAEIPGVLVLTGHIAISKDGMEASLGVNEHYELTQ
jgi:outer membrane protein assembly factor BamA